MAIRLGNKFANQIKGDSTVKVANVTGESNGFRAPLLRNVDFTSARGHDGALDTHDGAIDAQARLLITHAALGAQDKYDIIEFLHSLSGRVPQRPLNYWPDG